MEDFFEWLLQQYQQGKIEMHILFNGIDYDKNFYYNRDTNFLTADSSTSTGMGFVSESQTVIGLVNNCGLQIKLILK